MNVSGIRPITKHGIRTATFAVLSMLFIANASAGLQSESVRFPSPWFDTCAGLSVNITRVNANALHPNNASPNLIAHKDPKAILDDMEQAISAGNVNTIRAFLAKKVFLNLFTGENGLYSSDQSYFILKNFFSNQPVKSFVITRRADSADSPYAVGILRFRKSGMKSTAQVFISLTETNGEWAVNQITIALR